MQNNILNQISSSSKSEKYGILNLLIWISTFFIIFLTDIFNKYPSLYIIQRNVRTITLILNLILVVFSFLMSLSLITDLILKKNQKKRKLIFIIFISFPFILTMILVFIAFLLTNY